MLILSNAERRATVSECLSGCDQAWQALCRVERLLQTSEADIKQISGRCSPWWGGR